MKFTENTQITKKWDKK